MIFLILLSAVICLVACGHAFDTMDSIKWKHATKNQRRFIILMGGPIFWLLYFISAVGDGVNRFYNRFYETLGKIDNASEKKEETK